MSAQSSSIPASGAAVAPAGRSKKHSLAASTVGNILEWYEWSAYAVFAPFIAAAMFNPDDPVSALLSTLAVFAVGFLMRPLGGIVFGRIADKKGRKFVLITTMLMMAGGSLVIGLMPTYATVGVWASVILLLARVGQGFAHGGESATANTYVAEIAPANRRGMWGSIVFVAIFAGSVLAYTVGGTVTAVLEESEVAAWGWRIPFILGAFLALAALYLRKGMDESDVFHEENNAQAADQPTPLARKQVVRSVLLMIAMTSGITAAHYTWTSYASTYAITQQGMSASSAYWSSVIAQLIALCSLPFWGRLSDKVGRRPMMIGFAAVMILVQLPLMGMISSEPWTLLVAASLALLVVAVPGALLAATLSENFPTKVRTQSIGFAYSISVAVFGGTAPYLNALLIELGVGWLSSVYIMFLCACTAVAVWLMPETKGIDLKDA
ncbi:MFS transporter [Arthrobacter sp. zg-Y820]|uniref:MFS transporter n=1 Tax=unclassified Arthrobacter TaxID=235627 RepID=UPI001E2C8730|nr:MULTISPECIES: MFS transporter [unclassified Arthrobacter]MCC9195288.1 MFS transporter [Arthrobacter sp. zg-Y820]MDK1278147.1 MFS transporter [Arthrobacter sp. zg.Y820]WIB10034.1 MFS transporter [Arthrobacter sp. zg-Y820]